MKGVKQSKQEDKDYVSTDTGSLVLKVHED